MYAKVIDVLGDEPSAEGYYAEAMNGRLNARAERWREVFVTRPRPEWIERLRSAGVACEPVAGPGEALADPHLAEIGLAHHDDRGRPRRRARRLAHHDRTAGRRGTVYARESPGRGCSKACGSSTSRRSSPDRSPPRCSPTSGPTWSRSNRPRARRCGRPRTRSLPASGASAASPSTSAHPTPVPSSSGCSAGPTSCCTTSGSACRAARASTRRPVAKLNPGPCYCHASAFGPTGPRACSPGNDTLMQALAGFEAAIGGDEERPDRGDLDPDRHERRLAGGDRHPRRPLRPAPRRHRPAGVDQPPRRRHAPPQRCVPARRRDRPRPGARPPTRPDTGPATGCTGAPTTPGWPSSSPTPTPGTGCDHSRSSPTSPSSTHRCAASAHDDDARRAEVVLESAFVTAAARRWLRSAPIAGLLTELVDDVDRDGVPPPHPRRPGQPGLAGPSPTRPPTGAASSRSVRCSAAAPMSTAAPASTSPASASTPSRC